MTETFKKRKTIIRNLLAIVQRGGLKAARIWGKNVVWAIAGKIEMPTLGTDHRKVS